MFDFPVVISKVSNGYILTPATSHEEIPPDDTDIFVFPDKAALAQFILTMGIADTAADPEEPADVEA